ncbi:hypothetical protein C8Q79DRAFT_941690 [Trametes meyenii]|nr:hypothetical protein C8Q79DRAFT_941690 [Trametes meyenii]
MVINLDLTSGFQTVPPRLPVALTPSESPSCVPLLPRDDPPPKTRWALLSTP